MHQMINKNYFKDGKVYVWKETFAIIKSKKPYPSAFANIIDKNETTVIIEQSKYNEENVLEIEEDWKILTFDMVLPFELVVFLLFSLFLPHHFFHYFKKEGFWEFCRTLKYIDH